MSKQARIETMSEDDQREMTDFADLLRAKAGLRPTDKLPEPVCLLRREPTTASPRRSRP